MGHPGHDPPSASPALASYDDVLSDVLASVHLTGAMLFVVEASRPWQSWAPAAQALRPLLLPAAQHLVSYHIVTEGSCWAGLQGTQPQRYDAGDVFVVPHGDAYFLADPADAPPSYGSDEALRFLRGMAAGELPTTVRQGRRGAQRTRFICAFLGCQRRPFNPVLSALPPALHLRHAARAPDRLQHLIDFALAELRERSSGGRGVLTRLAELMFIEIVRRHLDSADAATQGWLAGLREPLVARALAQMHGAASRHWTLDALAQACGASRSVLAERFVHFVGLPPMQYLTQWRLQCASRLLADPGAGKVAAVAQAVGYASEAAFSRAFKKATGVAPSHWRRRLHP
jgi:AraC-like DNA-binding protein